MTDKRIVLTTAGSHSEAHKIAHALVEQRLAACVNIVPQVESIYRWQGAVETSQEWLLIVKTAASRLARLQQEVRKLHSYELPEFIVLGVEDGSKEYLDWLEESVKSAL